ncbi:MAG: NAD-dependent epimerase/dehydratase family protein [Patescibacteria group bacterium]|nr:NAD-dependent epimerase/dehydratase family protein [Patescibacteria group bacterium]
MSNFWRDRSVFVTGGTGFLGRYLIESLHQLNTDLTGLVRDARRGTYGFGRRTVWGDVRDQALLERAIGESRARTVFHLAAQTQVQVANENPCSTWDTNVRGTWSLLEACRRCPTVEQVVVASSDKAYGETAHHARPNGSIETDSLNAVHPYDVSKACADRLCQSYARTWGLPVAVTRCANLFGPGDRNWDRLIPGTIRNLLRGERPVLRGDGKAIRDYLYVGDAVDGYLRLAEAMSYGSLAEGKMPAVRQGAAFNFSLGVQHTSREIVDLCSQAVRQPGYDYRVFDPEVQNAATNEISVQQLDSSLARRVLGWEPKVGMEEGLRLAVEWYKENI